MAAAIEGQKGKPCGDGWIRADFTCHDGETEQQKAGAILFTIRKATKLQSKAARIRKIKELKSRIKDEPFLNTLVKELGLAHGNADPKEALERIAKLHSLLESEEEKSTPPPKLPYAPSLVKPVPPINADAIALDVFDRISPDRRTPQSNAVAEATNEYVQATKAITALASRMQMPVTNQQEYDVAFDEINAAFDQLKAATVKVQGLPDVKTGDAALDREINENLAYMRRTSKESLPGYKVETPADLDKIAKKAQSDPCRERSGTLEVPRNP